MTNEEAIAVLEKMPTRCCTDDLETTFRMAKENEAINVAIEQLRNGSNEDDEIVTIFDHCLQERCDDCPARVGKYKELGLAACELFAEKETVEIPLIVGKRMLERVRILKKALIDLEDEFTKV